MGIEIPNTGPGGKAGIEAQQVRNKLMKALADEHSMTVKELNGLQRDSGPIEGRGQYEKFKGSRGGEKLSAQKTFSYDNVSTIDFKATRGKTNLNYLESRKLYEELASIHEEKQDLNKDAIDETIIDILEEARGNQT